MYRCLVEQGAPRENYAGASPLSPSGAAERPQGGHMPFNRFKSGKVLGPPRIGPTCRDWSVVGNEGVELTQEDILRRGLHH